MRRALAIAATGLLVTAAAAAQTTPTSEQTHPRVHPSRGHRHTAFAVWFTLRHDAGHAGVTETAYRVQVDPPAHARAACRPDGPPAVTGGRAGDRVHVKLVAPRVGWCQGRYAATIELETGPYCPPPTPGEPPPPCPEFASRELPTGTAHFRVTR